MASRVAGSSSDERSPAGLGERGGADGPAQDLGAAGLGQRRGEADAAGWKTPSRSATNATQLGAQRFARPCRALRHHEAHSASPLSSSGTPIAAASTTAG